MQTNACTHIYFEQLSLVCGSSLYFRIFSLLYFYFVYVFTAGLSLTRVASRTTKYVTYHTKLVTQCRGIDTSGISVTRRVWSRDGKFGSKVGQVGPKWDKSGDFSDHILRILAHRAKCTESDMKKSLDLSHLGSI